MAKNINFINITNGTIFGFENDLFGEPIKKKKTPFVSRFTYQDLVSHSFKLNTKQTKEEILFQTELKMYEDAGVDPAKENLFAYVKKNEISDIETLYEGFSVDTGSIKQKYQEGLKKHKSIDFMAIPFLTYEVLYETKLLDIKNDIFVYIDTHEAFTASYKDGRYISSKKLKSIAEMVTDLGHKNIHVTEEELSTMITQKGLVRESYELLQYEIYEYLQEMFVDLFTKIKNLSLHNRNVYRFEKTDRIFVCCSGGFVPQLESEVENIVQDAQILPYNFLPEKPEEINPLDAVATRYIAYKLSQNDQLHNLTIYPKRVSFLKQEVGKFSLVAAASIMLCAAYPVYQQYEISILSQENTVLKSNEQRISHNAKKIEQALKNIKNEISAVETEKENVFTELQTLRSIADALLALQSQDTKYTTMLLKINDVLKQYNLSVEAITHADKQALNLELTSNENKRDTIALMMKDLLQIGFDSVTSNEITVDENEIYKSIVTVKR